MSKLQSLTAREILDSRGNPTLEVLCVLESGTMGQASVPSGASTGAHEALELRDHDTKRYNGLGVLRAIENVNKEISENIIKKEFDQQTLDKFLINLDGTKDKSRLGANAILGVSMAFARGVATEEKIELYEYLGKLAGNTEFKIPQPFFNIINGGKHADSGIEIQEFMIAPTGWDTIAQKIQTGTEIISCLRENLKRDGYTVGLGDEGGFAPKLGSNEEALEYIMSAITDAGYTREQVKMGLDVAASSFYKENKYEIKMGGEKVEPTSIELIAWYKSLIDKYPIISIEDGLAEDDWAGFTEMNKELGGKIKIVGDDLTVTNLDRIKTAAEKNSINSVLIKLNQIGTLTETIEAIELTRAKGWVPFVSHRSGETTDTFIADLAVGLSCPYIKSGSLARGERICKYNRLMEIEEKLNKS